MRCDSTPESPSAWATTGPSRPPTGIRPAATAAIKALDTWAATGCALAQSTRAAIVRIASAVPLAELIAAARTCCQSTARNASAAASTSASSTGAGGSSGRFVRSAASTASSCCFGPP